MKKAIQGDTKAFDLIIEQEKPRLLAKAISYVDNQEDALDIVQETCLKAYQSIYQLKEPKYFSTWLFKILIHECYAALSKRKRTLVVETEQILQQLDHVDNSPLPYDFVHEALTYIRNEYRTAIVLHYFYDFSLIQIGEMLNKPLNTIKMYLYRGRLSLKHQMETIMYKPIEKEVMINMLKEQLAEKALKFVSMPDDFKLIIEDYSDDQVSFAWAADDYLNDGIAVTLNNEGKLIELSIDSYADLNMQLSIVEKRMIAENFLHKEHPEALQYFTLSSTEEKEKSSKFTYEQFVAGSPLSKPYCKIEVSSSGEVINFNYRSFTKTIPNVPKQLFDKDKLLTQCIQQAKWQLQLRFLSKDVYTIEQSGLFLIYENEQFYKAFDAVTGKTSFAEDEEELPESFLPFPHIPAQAKQHIIEEIIGIPRSMTRIREEEMDDCIAIVWRDENWDSPNDLTFDSFIRERSENTVKVKIDKETKKLKEFLWFKERAGNLQLSYEQCKEIAYSFIATHFEEFVPFMLIKDGEPSLNEESQRAFFKFYLHIGDGQLIDGEHFYLSVNMTTGFIEFLMHPYITVDEIKAFDKKSLITEEHFKNVWSSIDAILKWDLQYDEDEPYEKLVYKLCEKKSKKKIACIDAVTGEIIGNRY